MFGKLYNFIVISNNTALTILISVYVHLCLDKKMSFENLDLEIENLDDIKKYLDQIGEAAYILLGFTGPMSIAYQVPSGGTILFTVRKGE